MSLPELPQRERLAVASLSGAVSRMTRGDQRDLSRPAKLLRIRTLTTDPLVLGHVLGAHLKPEHPEYAGADAEAVELLRESGADEATAELVARWQVDRRERRDEGGFQL